MLHESVINNAMDRLNLAGKTMSEEELRHYVEDFLSRALARDFMRKRFAARKLDSGNAIAFNGEAGYQARLMMPGVQFKLWPLYDVTRHPMVQIPAGQIGVVIAQAGAPLPVGAKSGVYKSVFGNFDDLNAFVDGGGQKGVQRPVLRPARWCRSIRSAFWSSPSDTVYGVPIERTMRHSNAVAASMPASFGLQP